MVKSLTIGLVDDGVATWNPIILSVQLVPDREQWSAWAELDIFSSKYTGMPWARMGIWESTSRERPQVVAI